MDTLTTAERSRQMATIRGKNTKPEMLVRRMVHAMGYRYRLHRRDLPGCPDLVLGPQHKVIFVHGCFWHRHSAKNCKLARLPKSKLGFWALKLEGNRARDVRNQRALKKAGWRVLVVWECELCDKVSVRKKLQNFLRP